MSVFTVELQVTFQAVTHCSFNLFNSFTIYRRLIHLAHSKKLREQQGKILLEGRRLISEALEAGASPLTVFFSALERLQELPVNKLAQASLVKVKLEDVRIWPDLEAEVDMIGRRGGICVFFFCFFLNLCIMIYFSHVRKIGLMSCS